MTEILYPLLTAALWYLLSRAQLTRALWSRYPRWFAVPADCAACAGAWLGGAVAVALQHDIYGLDGQHWATPPLVGLLSMVWTPLVAALHQHAMIVLGTALDEEAL